MISIRNNQTGQSLMEMLIAIFILIVALTATIVLVVTSINAGRDSINKLIATNLAREGVEVVRNIRDGNWIEPTNLEAWDVGLDLGPIVAPVIAPFDLDTDNTSFVVSVDIESAQAQVYFTQTSNFYYQNYSGELPAEQVNFYRIIYLNDICQDVNDSTDERIVPLENSNDCVTQFNASFYKVGIRVIAEVRWPNPNSIRKVQIEDRLYNWQRL